MDYNYNNSNNTDSSNTSNNKNRSYKSLFQELNNISKTSDYESVAQYDDKHDKEGHKKCSSELAKIFDQCMLNKKETLHKCNIFQLLKNYRKVPHNDQRRGSPKFLVFDCNDRDICSVKYSISSHCDVNRIRY